MNHSPRDLYLNSLDPSTELNARRIAERSRIPDDDPMWLMLHEMHQSVRELTTGSSNALANDAFSERLANSVATSVLGNERIVSAIAVGIASVHDTSIAAIRTLERDAHQVARRRSLAPVSSLIFAMSLTLVAGFAAIWSSYTIGSGYGYDLGYRAGYHDGMLYERNRK